MRILLIWPSVKDGELFNFLPLGLGYVASNLPDGCEARLWDGVIKKEPNSGVLEEIALFKPDLIGISIWNFNLASAREVAELIRGSYPEITIVVGGPEPSGRKEKIFEVIDADYGFAGESEKPFRKFIETAAENGFQHESIRDISGIIYKDDTGVPVLAPVKWESIEDINYCDYELIDLKGYLDRGYHYGMHSRAIRTAPLLTTRGCPYSCEYCSARMVNGRKIRARKVESVIEEIKELHHTYKIDGFNIIDDNFTFYKDYAKEVCREILKLELKNVSFNSPNGVRVEFLDKELLSIMKKVGWECVFIAPESGSERTLKNMKKKLDLNVVAEKITMIKNAGMKVFGFFIIGYPGETEKDINKSFDFARNNGFDYVVYTCFHPLAGTPATDKLEAAGEWIETGAGGDYYDVAYAPDGLTKRKLRMLRLWGLFRFYTSSFSRMYNAATSHSLKRKLLFIKKLLIPSRSYSG